MKTFKVEINDGTVNTHRVMVRARHHEEAERMALLATRIRFEDVLTMTTEEK